MNFNPHFELRGKHSIFSPSKYYWSNYSEEEIEAAYYSSLAVERGNELHEFAAKAIRLGIKLQNNKTTMSMYVNDAIGYGMTPEQPLYYSDYFFGTTDAISFKRNLLRIHDLKTGEKKPGSMRQLEIYDALFCLEYNVKPSEIKHELRIYQFDKITVHEPDPEFIAELMSKIKVFDQKIDAIHAEEWK